MYNKLIVFCAALLISLSVFSQTPFPTTDEVESFCGTETLVVLENTMFSTYNAFISAGNTGPVVAASTIFLVMLEGAERPAIGTVLPTLRGFSLMIDAGANTTPKDRWGGTPLDDARRGHHERIVELIEQIT